MIIIIITNTKQMSNIIQFNTFKNNKQFPTNEADKVHTLYYSLIDSGYSSCFAHHEVMKLLLARNPKLELSNLSKTISTIINPLIDNYYENGIDNHSHN
jgi:hypothetical protein